MHRLAPACFAILAALILASAAGCSSVPHYFSDDRQLLDEPTGEPLVARPNSPIPDAPMPVGFVMVETRSRAYTVAGGGRFVEHCYQGRAEKADVMRFYHEQLARNGWTNLSEQNQSGNITSFYSKGPESLRLSVTGDAVTTVVITIRNRHGVAPSAAPARGARPAAP
jgi:hypothetical protein